MSPASKSKSKDKKSAKEPPKSASKPSGPSNSSAYNPLLGTFHTLETVQNLSALPLQANGRFRNIDETDDHLGGSIGAEYDSISNNGSWSGESEDHKEKSSNPPARHEMIPPGADNDKREKIRQKNEKKHQRQKERRAQELHERCSGYLMSRKLEALAQQLVAMGFSHERATMALILNEGRVEESVSWLFEGVENADQQMDQKLSGANLKIDISEELAQIADMEIRYKCSKQEVERAVVSTEGGLEKAAEILQKQKQDAAHGPPKLQETGDPPTIGNGELSMSHNLARLQSKAIPTPSNQQRRDERDFNYTKLGATAAVGGPSESGLKTAQPVKRILPKLEWAKPQQATMPAEKRWPVPGSSPSVSYSLASSPVQASLPQAKLDTRYVASGGEMKNFQPGSVREPVIMMQRPQSTNSKQVSSTHIGSPPGTGSNWYPTGSLEMMKSNGVLPQFPTNANRNLAQSSLGGSSQVYNQLHYQQQYSLGNGFGDFAGGNRGNGSWSRSGATPTLAAVSSLGLFSGLGSSASSGTGSPVDWTNGGSMIQLDYTNIDWTLDQGLCPSRPGNLWLGLANFMRNNANNGYDFGAPGADSKPMMRSALNGNGVSVPFSGLQDPGAETSAMGSREWTSPFEGKDLFSLPRRFVSSPPPL
ncbi:hypothetical protein CDL15_Pgr025299 [Punica granatum]|uniref:UBA domain-containing protein n=1 Tax=Punica granatum TaxID=22663 RepID=A0A218WAK0_PUNGR|nr:hypothetical protein CDL15_Pgr025299 [Punica granatum]PKI57808.1 hypothetical protein CRG98_021875 [Punica granatum]